MNYITFGNKKNPAIIFLHGWGGCSKSWGVVPIRLAGFGFYSVVIDFNGFGESPEPNREFGVVDYALEVEELARKLKLKNISIVGHSFGGRVAIKLASLNLIDIKKLILVDSAGIVPKRGFKYKFAVWRYKELKKKVAQGKKDAYCLEKYGSSDYKQLSEVMRKTFVKIVNEDLSFNAQSIDLPTLLIWGRNDNDTPFYMAKRLKKLIKNSRLEVYPAGHFAYLECMDEFIDDVYGFLLSG